MLPVLGWSFLSLFFFSTRDKRTNTYSFSGSFHVLVHGPHFCNSGSFLHLFKEVRYCTKEILKYLDIKNAAVLGVLRH